MNDVLDVFPRSASISIPCGSRGGGGQLPHHLIEQDHVLQNGIAMGMVVFLCCEIIVVQCADIDYVSPSQLAEDCP